MKKYEKLTSDQYLEIIKKLESKKKYGLIWEEEKNKEIFEKLSINSLPILERIKSNCITTSKKEPVNILIEGDNFHSLSCLNYTHKNKIDLIYIDPPYNTGNKDFIYNDKWVEKDDSYRHSKWLSFISKRLTLAKNLLLDDGAIVISIDINEMSQLKLLCDKIFGEKNLVSLITVKVKDPAGVGQESYLFDVSEYCLIYAKKIDYFKKTYNDLPQENLLINDKENFIQEHKSYKYFISKYGKSNKIKIIDRQNVGKISIHKNINYELKKTKDLSYKEIIDQKNNIFADYNPSGGMIKAIINEIPEKGLSYIEYTPTKGRSKNQITKVFFYNRRILAPLEHVISIDKNKIVKKTKMSNIWNVSNSSLHLEGNVSFDNGKKPINLIKKIIKLFPKKNLKILDFFAGSGTTGEAILSLNKEDGHKRSFILSNTNEEINVKSSTDKKLRICRDITFKRLKNSIQGYGSNKPTNGNLNYYKCSFVAKSLNKDELKIKISNKVYDMLCMHEEIYNEVLSNKKFKIFKNEDKILAIFFSIDYDDLKILKNKLKDYNLKKILYVFTLDPLGIDMHDFRDWKDIEIKPIPQKIIDIYNTIYVN